MQQGRRINWSVLYFIVTIMVSKMQIVYRLLQILQMVQTVTD